MEFTHSIRPCMYNSHRIKYICIYILKQQLVKEYPRNSIKIKGSDRYVRFLTFFYTFRIIPAGRQTQMKDFLKNLNVLPDIHGDIVLDKIFGCENLEE